METSWKGKFKNTVARFVYEPAVGLWRVEFQTAKNYEVTGYINEREISNYWNFLSKDKTKLVEMTPEDLKESNTKAKQWELDHPSRW